MVLRSEGWPSGSLYFWTVPLQPVLRTLFLCTPRDAGPPQALSCALSSTHRWRQDHLQPPFLLSAACMRAASHLTSARLVSGLTLMQQFKLPLESWFFHSKGLNYLSWKPNSYMASRSFPSPQPVTKSCPFRFPNPSQTLRFPGLSPAILAESTAVPCPGHPTRFSPH